MIRMKLNKHWQITLIPKFCIESFHRSFLACVNVKERKREWKKERERMLQAAYILYTVDFEVCLRSRYMRIGGKRVRNSKDSMKEIERERERKMITLLKEMLGETWSLVRWYYLVSSEDQTDEIANLAVKRCSVWAAFCLGRFLILSIILLGRAWIV